MLKKELKRQWQGTDVATLENGQWQLWKALYPAREWEGSNLQAGVLWNQQSGGWKATLPLTAEKSGKFNHFSDCETGWHMNNVIWTPWRWSFFKKSCKLFLYLSDGRFFFLMKSWNNQKRWIIHLTLKQGNVFLLFFSVSWEWGTNLGHGGQSPYLKRGKHFLEGGGG